jgi:ankyrin repeat protein
MHSIFLKFVADRKQTLSECGVSVTAGKHIPSKVKKLIENGCDPNEQNAEGKTLLHHAGDSSSYVETLLALGSRIDIVDNDGNTSIHLAVKLFQESCLAALLQSSIYEIDRDRRRIVSRFKLANLHICVSGCCHLLDAGGESEDVDGERAV